MLEIKHLRSFLRVLDLGSFSKAARSLNIAQPVLSQHVRKLEDRLAVTLMERSAHGVKATHAGREFAKNAREILELADRTERQFKSKPGSLFGEVRLGLPGSVCPIIAPVLIARAAQLYPNIKLILSEFMSGDLADRLREGRIDGAILFNVDETDDYTSKPLIEEKLHLVGAPDAAHVQTPAIAASTLTQLPLVSTRPPHGLRLLLEQWSNTANIELNFTVEADAPSVLVSLAAEGGHYSILSAAAVKRELAAGLLASAEITGPAIERTACLCTSKRLPSNQAREALTKLLETTIRDLVSCGSWTARIL